MDFNYFWDSSINEFYFKIINMSCADWATYLNHEMKTITANIGFHASWAWPANINQLQIQAVVRAGQTIFNFSS